VFLMGEDVGRYGGGLCLFQGTAGGIRRRARPAMRRCPSPASPAPGSARRPQRDAADRGSDDGQFQPAGAGPDRQQRGDLAPHDRRPGVGSAGYPHGYRRRPPTRRAAFAQPGMLVCARARDSRADARHRGRCPRHALDRVARSRSGGDLSSMPVSTTTRARSPPRANWPSTSIAPRCAGRVDVTSSLMAVA